MIEELDMTRIDPDTLIVKYIDPLVHQRLYKLDFHETYVKALRNALDLVRAGMQKVSIIQKREVLHDHENLVRASENIHRFATDEDLIEQAHHSSYSYDDRLLASAMRNAAHSGVVVWASL